jgi:hypothetical protein
MKVFFLIQMVTEFLTKFHKAEKHTYLLELILNWPADKLITIAMLLIQISYFEQFIIQNIILLFIHHPVK